MPYMRFPFEEEKKKVYGLHLKLAAENGGLSPGLMAIVSDPLQGLVYFYSKEPYQRLFDAAGIYYELVDRKEINAPHVAHLRERYAKFSEEL
ncbi:MAG TPA: hypothetical protein VJC21_02455 [Candidatus Nanoarchaeia archaeon]|nr:hypothetical protein [Candidatus Nanoarchaeia archaeon]